MRNLIYYGEKKDWKIFSNHDLLPYVKDAIDKIYIFTKINDLWYFLCSEGKGKLNYIIPVNISDMKQLHEQGIPAIMPSLNTINVFDDKKQFSHYVEDCGLSNYVPKTYSNYENEFATNNTIVIVKDPHGVWGIGSDFKKLSELHPDHFKYYVIQEYIKNPVEYAAHIAAKNGIIKYSIVYKKFYNEGMYIAGRDCLNGMSFERVVLDSHYMNMLEQFLSACKYTGPCCIDFKISNNKVYVFEINCRFGSTLVSNIKDLSKIILHLI